MSSSVIPGPSSTSETELERAKRLLALFVKRIDFPDPWKHTLFATTRIGALGEEQLDASDFAWLQASIKPSPEPPRKALS